MIHAQKKIPGQWKAAKMVPVFKNKANVNNMVNYGPIAYLCCTSKPFEELILKSVLKI
jgi:hypothetical protein